MKLNRSSYGKNIDAISQRQGKGSSCLLLGVNAASLLSEVLASARVLEKVET